MSKQVAYWALPEYSYVNQLTSRLGKGRAGVQTLHAICKDPCFNEFFRSRALAVYLGAMPHELSLMDFIAKLYSSGVSYTSLGRDHVFFSAC